MSSLHLMRPEWLWCLIPALLIFLVMWRQRQRHGSWSDVIDPDLLPVLISGKLSNKGVSLLPVILLAWLIVATAASGPSTKKISQPVHQQQDALILVLDLSYSMKSADLPPSRIDRARQKLLDLLARRQEGQTGLIAYAGDAHIVTPLTDDTATIINLLPALHPDMMPVPGSQPGQAIKMAVELLHSAGINQGRILLVTDGVSDRHQTELGKHLKGSGASLSVLGIGTQSGAPIPLPGGGFLKDEKGAIVMPTLQESPLQAIANESGGRYMRMQIDDSDLDSLLAQGSLPMRQPTLALDRTADTWEDQGYLLLLLLLPVVVALFRKGWVACLIPLLLLSPVEPARADLWDNLWLRSDQQGQKALGEGNAERAAELFEDSRWSGIASYQAGDYSAAQEAFTKGDDADSWYNLGNALAREGRLDDAIHAYRESLQRQPDQQDALQNVELLEQLKEEQQQQQQQQQQDQGDDQQSQNQPQSPGDPDSQQEPDQKGERQQSQSGEETNPQSPDQPNSRPQESGSQGTEQEQERPDSESREQPSSEAESHDGTSPNYADSTQRDAEQQERDQAMEQWLRRVPDDPSGLLREKFRYESQKRQQQGVGNSNEQIW